MHFSLKRLLKKRGIDDVTKLQPEEKADFDRWQKILSEGEITLDKIGEFCRAQKTITEKQMRNLDNSYEKNAKLVLLHSVYSAILEAITAPQAERESLEKYLNALLEEKS